MSDDLIYTPSREFSIAENRLKRAGFVTGDQKHADPTWDQVAQTLASHFS